MTSPEEAASMALWAVLGRTTTFPAWAKEAIKLNNRLDANGFIRRKEQDIFMV